MSQKLTISDSLYERLQAAARLRGFDSIEELLETWQTEERELRQRREIVQKIEPLRERLFATYGEMPDSATLIREDRSR